MKPIYLINIILISILIGISFVFGTAWADEEIQITSDEQVKELYAGKKWKCNWEDGPSDNVGTKEYTFDTEISMKNITGKVENSYCPGKVGTLQFIRKVMEAIIRRVLTPINGQMEIPLRVKQLVPQSKFYEARLTSGFLFHE